MRVAGCLVRANLIGPAAAFSAQRQQQEQQHQQQQQQQQDINMDTRPPVQPAVKWTHLESTGAVVGGVHVVSRLPPAASMLRH
eukprot:748970-Rhodomonas_salina.2